MKKIYVFLSRLISKIQRESQPDYPHISPTSFIGNNVKIFTPDELYMEENTNIYDNAHISGKFIMKKNSGAAQGLVALGGNHMSVVGMYGRQITEDVKNKLDFHKDYSAAIVVNEDVWIGVNVTLLQGVHIGRGCIVGAGSVVRKSIPPYSIVVGNPAKIVGFKFTPEEIIEHEKALYLESERLPIDLIEKNYNKYYKNRIKEIRSFLKI